MRELSKPIEKDGREHIEYVPTQIVAEYLKYKCKSIDSKRKRIKGILYPSSRCNGISCALFLRNTHCVDKTDNDPKAFLKLVYMSEYLQKIKPRKVPYGIIQLSPDRNKFRF